MNEPQQPSLPEYAQGLAQLDIEVQRQTDGYGSFRSIVQAIDALTVDPSKDRPALPFIIVRSANSQGPTPHEMKIDLNLVPAAELGKLRPCFDYLMRECGESMLQGWENIFELASQVQPVVMASRQRQQQPAPAQPQPQAMPNAPIG